jgi:hypothetical protein
MTTTGDGSVSAFNEREAKRRIVALHSGDEDWRCQDDWVEHNCPTLRALAIAYADHPDYREEWRLTDGLAVGGNFTPSGPVVGGGPCPTPGCNLARGHDGPFRHADGCVDWHDPDGNLACEKRARGLVGE